MSDKVTRRSMRQELKKELGAKNVQKDDSNKSPPPTPDIAGKAKSPTKVTQNEKEASKASGVKVIPSRKAKPVVNKKLESDWAAKLLPDHEWSVGEIVWARMRGSPYWPSLVTKDPSSGEHYNTGLPVGSKKQVHVTFFANNAKHSWVPFESTTKFEGLTAFQKLISDLGINKREQENYFSPKRSMKATWERAAMEAEDCMKKEVVNRLDFLEDAVDSWRQMRVSSGKRKSDVALPETDVCEPENSKV
ncbi:histone-lysine N-methyltransferase NSD2 isoform X2 [Anabrus simplex]|uniref:histone-lysine N-methyltransferase NSD2 isoform X2 n=1 Tax=Anabrus simplex TaxID=316456 RepID=UPI0034DDC5AC